MERASKEQVGKATTDRALMAEGKSEKKVEASSNWAALKTPLHKSQERQKRQETNGLSPWHETFSKQLYALRAFSASWPLVQPHAPRPYASEHCAVLELQVSDQEWKLLLNLLVWRSYCFSLCFGNKADSYWSPANDEKISRSTADNGQARCSAYWNAAVLGRQCPARDSIVLSNFWKRPLHALSPVPDLLVGFSLCDSIDFLDSDCKLLTFSGDLTEIILRKLAPVVLGRAY